VPLHLGGGVRRGLSWTDAAAQQTTACGTGLRFVAVEHVGNVAASSEEAERVAAMIRELHGASWTSADGVTAALGDGDFMVVARTTLRCAGAGRRWIWWAVWGTGGNGG
jgi:hypothetical protein